MKGGVSLNLQFLFQINQFLWSGPILVLLLSVHIYHTFHFSFIQRKIGRGIRLSLGDKKSSSGQFSRFGTLTTTLAATLGTGNIVGVSTAVYLGGPGAVFWCWLTGVLGMATTYAETRLCTKYRFPDEKGILHASPMHLMKHLLGKKVMAWFYAFFLCISALFIGCTTQSNAISDTCREVFQIPIEIPAILTAFVVGIILFQGTKWIEGFSMTVVPSMAIFFFGGCILYLILHSQFILPALRQIISSSFGFSQIGGGITGFTLGKALRFGVARGLFTNEAGLGTAGLIAGNSAEEKPENQALVSMSATFWDTVVLCGITGVVLVSFMLEYPSEWMFSSAGSLTTAAFSKLPFFGKEILAVAILCFAAATLVGWSYIGKEGFSFAFSEKYTGIFHVIYILMIFIGGVMPLTLVWELTDFFNLFLLIPSCYLLFRCRNQ